MGLDVTFIRTLPALFQLERGFGRSSRALYMRACSSSLTRDKKIYFEGHNIVLVPGNSMCWKFKGARWSRWSTPRPSRFTPWNELWYVQNSRLGGPRGQSRRMKTENLLPPAGIQSPDHPSRTESQYRPRELGDNKVAVRKNTSKEGVTTH